MREILASAVQPQTRVQMGDALAALGCELGLADEDFEVFNEIRDKSPAEPPRFE